MNNYMKTVISGIKVWVEKFFVKKDDIPKSDWNENNPESAAYIMNKPFSDTTKTFTVECTTVDANILEDFPVFNVGDTVTVTVDGVEHSLIAYDEQGLATVGDNFDSLSDGEGLDWQIYAIDSARVCFLSHSNSHTVSYTVTEIHKIDEQYLPDSVATKAYVDANAGGGASSWNDLEDKPFWESEPVDTVLVDNVSVEAADTSPFVNDPFSIEFVDGDIYRVIYDDTEYECIAYIAEGPNTPSIGNGEVGGVAGGDGEPFFITVFNGHTMFFAAESGTHTISISCTKSNIHTLDNKYLDFMDVKKPRVIVSEQEITTEWNTYIGYKYTIEDKSAADFNDGSKYIVTMDGVEYECIASVTYDNGHPNLRMGNMALSPSFDNGQGDTGEPFCICSAFVNDGVIHFVTENVETHIIEVKSVGSSKINRNFLPLRELREELYFQTFRVNKGETTYEELNRVELGSIIISDDDVVKSYGSQFLVFEKSLGYGLGNDKYLNFTCLSVVGFQAYNTSVCELSFKFNDSGEDEPYPETVVSDISFYSTRGYVIGSSDSDSQKEFRITVDDSGTIKVVGITDDITSEAVTKTYADETYRKNDEAIRLTGYNGIYVEEVPYTNGSVSTMPPYRFDMTVGRQGTNSTTLWLSANAKSEKTSDIRPYLGFVDKQTQKKATVETAYEVMEFTVGCTDSNITTKLTLATDGTLKLEDEELATKSYVEELLGVIENGSY